MAAEADVSISSERVQRLLQCAVCLDRFKHPKLLPCQHTFCLSPCLEGLVEHRTRSIRCPECRADHFIPRGGVASFPNNLTIIGFLSLSDTSYPDQIQEESRPVDRSENSDGPRLNESSRQPVRENAVDNGGCYVCYRQTMIQRCCHCDHLVCEACHQEHMNLVRNELGRLISAVRQGLPHITDQVMSVRRKGTQLQSRCENVKTEVTEGVEKLIRELRARERTLREDVDTFYTGEMRSLRNFQENAEVEIASLCSFCDTSEDMLGERRRIPAGDLMETKRQCEEHLETVQSYEDGTTRSPNPKQIQVSLESSFLSSTISSLGELITSNNRISHLMMQQEGEGGLSTNLPSRNVTSRFEDGEEDSPGDNRGGISQHALLPQSQYSQSPLVSRRAYSSQTQPQRIPSVTFTDGNVTFSGEGSRWDTMSHATRPNRRSRAERVSDTALMNLRSARNISRVVDRARHQSLGGLQIDEYDSNDETMSDRNNDDLFSGLSDRIRSRHRDSGPRDLSSSSYPGTRSENTPSQSTLYCVDSPLREDTREDFHDTPSSLSSILRRHTPGRPVDTPRNGYNQKGNAIIEIGTRGSELGQFIWPRGLAVSHLDDRIYISDSSNHRVQIFTNTGQFVKSFGSYGQNEGEFDCLAGIAITHFEQVVISDRYNHRIQVFDRNGNFQNCFGREGSAEGELNYPWGIACDNMGFIYVCDKENHRVQVFQSNGMFVRIIGEHGNRIGQLENPHYVAVSPDNKVYVSDSSNHRIQVFSIYGDFLFSFGLPGSLRGQMKFPRGIAIDSQGFAVVADSGNNRIQVFRSDGRFYSMFGNWGSENGQFKGIEGVAIQANGNIVISDRENHRVQIF